MEEAVAKVLTKTPHKCKNPDKKIGMILKIKNK